MRQFDFTPIYRHSVGFDRFANTLDKLLSVQEAQTSYPPFNVEKSDNDSYRISIAVAGFTQDDIEIETKDNSLIIKGKQPENVEQDGRTFLHRGIASRAFERRFQLADHVRVTNAHLENGLLHIELVREVPEALKPRKIAIEGAKPSLTQN